MEQNIESNWIWMSSDGKTIDIQGVPAGGEIQISADTRYKLYINDKFVEAGPSRGDHNIWFYDTISTAPWLHQGPNVLSAVVLRYPEEPEKGNHGMFRTALPGL